MPNNAKEVVMPEYILIPLWPFALASLILTVIAAMILLILLKKKRFRQECRFWAGRELEHDLALLCQRAFELNKISGRIKFDTSAICKIVDDDCEPVIGFRLDELCEASEELNGYQAALEEDVIELYKLARVTIEGANSEAAESDHIAGACDSAQAADVRPIITKKALEAAQPVSAHVM